MTQSPLTPDEIDRLAHRRVRAKMGWFIHAAVYVGVNTMMFAVGHEMGHPRWSIFPAAGWGLGLMFHGLSVWVLGSGSTLRERLVERERQRLQRRQGHGHG